MVFMGTATGAARAEGAAGATGAVEVAAVGEAMGTATGLACVSASAGSLPLNGALLLVVSGFVPFGSGPCAEIDGPSAEIEDGATVSLRLLAVGAGVLIEGSWVLGAGLAAERFCSGSLSGDAWRLPTAGAGATADSVGTEATGISRLVAAATLGGSRRGRFGGGAIVGCRGSVFAIGAGFAATERFVATAGSLPTGARAGAGAGVSGRVTTFVATGAVEGTAALTSGGFGEDAVAGGTGAREITGGGAGLGSAGSSIGGNGAGTGDFATKAGWAGTVGVCNLTGAGAAAAVAGKGAGLVKTLCRGAGCPRFGGADCRGAGLDAMFLISGVPSAGTSDL